MYPEHAPRLWQAGWRGVLPLPTGRKANPPEGYTGAAGAWPSRADVQTWADHRPDLGSIALRLPPGVVGLDVDAYDGKPGAVTAAALEGELGALPLTVLSTARDDGVSGIRLYRALERPSWHDPGPGMEVVHAGWRYVVAPPSVHPSGRAYRWIDQRTGAVLEDPPSPDELPALPAAWAERLSSDRPPADKAAATDAEVVAWLEALPDGQPCAATTRHLAAFHEALKAGSRHDAMKDATAALARVGERGCTGVPGALREARSAFLAAVTAPGDRQRTEREAVAEWRRALAGAYRITKAEPTADDERGCPCVPELPAFQPPGEPGEPARTSWWPVDPGPYLDDGDDGEPPPTVLARADGHALLYPATVNAIQGESESMKSWLAQVAAAQTLTAGQLAVYVDFESTAGKVYGRLRALGVDRDTLARRCRYIRPADPLDTRAAGDLEETLAAAPALVVLDGITEALELHGLDLASNHDWSKFKRAVLNRCAASGACVLIIDHVRRAGEQGGQRYAIGAQHKRASVEGAAYTVAPLRPFGRGRHGIARLTVTKDRPGHVRGALTENGDQVAELHLRSNADGTRIHAELKPPGDGPAFRPTTLMEKVSRTLEGIAPEALSVRSVLDAVTGKQKAVRAALDVLVTEGYVRRETGARNALLHRHERAYRADEDPLNPERVPVSPPCPECVPATVGSDRSECGPCPHPFRGDTDTHTVTTAQGHTEPSVDRVTVAPDAARGDDEHERALQLLTDELGARPADPRYDDLATIAREGGAL